MRVFVTGGTGLVGSRVIAQLQARGDQPVVLTRRPAAAREKFGADSQVVEGDPMQPGPWQEAVADCEGVINLAGENIFNRRWNRAFLALLYDSRIMTTLNVVQALRRQPTRSDGAGKVLVNASAIGYYGPHGDEELTERSPPADDFMANLCVEWEKAALGAQAAGIRTVLVRVGIVLDRAGGALAKLLTPFKLGLGGPVGNGKQWMSWIHHEDLAGLFLFGLDHSSVSGPLNGTAPNPVTNRAFGKALGKALGRPAFLPTPALALRVMLGKVASVISTGQRVVPEAALRARYAFRYPTIDEALTNIVAP
jgi:uncharacterized protein (TIGR01777 family)